MSLPSIRAQPLLSDCQSWVEFIDIQSFAVISSWHFLCCIDVVGIFSGKAAKTAKVYPMVAAIFTKR